MRFYVQYDNPPYRIYAFIYSLSLSIYIYTVSYTSTHICLKAYMCPAPTGALVSFEVCTCFLFCTPLACTLTCAQVCWFFRPRACTMKCAQVCWFLWPRACTLKCAEVCCLGGPLGCSFGCQIPWGPPGLAGPLKT